MDAGFTIWVILAAVFGAVVLAILAAEPLLQRKINLAQRLSSAPSPLDSAQQLSAATGNVTLRTDQSSTVWARLIADIERRGLSLQDTKSGELAERLALAGYTQSYAVRAFVLIRTILTLLFPILAYFFVILTDPAASISKTYMTVVISAALGMYLPNFIVKSKAQSRREELLNGFPDTLDLMLVCVEAGLGIDACFARVGQEIVELHPRLAELFGGVSLELRAGRARAEALRNMARKSGVPEIQSFATLIIQSDRLGSSIGQALKVYGAEMREGRRMRAEEKAHRLPVLLAVPLVVFLLPTMIGVLMLPAAISMRSTLFAA
jgi:tight adherence protein C